MIVGPFRIVCDGVPDAVFWRRLALRAQCYQVAVLLALDGALQDVKDAEFRFVFFVDEATFVDELVADFDGGWGAEGGHCVWV